MERSAEMTGPPLSYKGQKVTELSEIPCRVSSDLHEWCNDMGTVSMRGSVKLEYR